MLARRPKCSQELLLISPGSSWAAPGASWAAPGCPEPCCAECPKPARSSFWPRLGALGLLLELPGLLLAARPPPQLPGSCNDPVGLPGYRMPKSSQELFLATPGCSCAAPGISWASNTLRHVCQHAAKLLPTCAELAQECKGGMGGKPRVSQKTLNPKRE